MFHSVSGPTSFFYFSCFWPCCIFCLHMRFYNQFVNIHKITPSHLHWNLSDSSAQVGENFHFDNIESPFHIHRIASVSLDFPYFLSQFFFLLLLPYIDFERIFLSLCLNISFFCANVNDTMVFILNSNRSLLVYRKAVLFQILNFYPSTLVQLLISSSRSFLLWKLWDFCSHVICK